jgi:hypothetical protein
MLKRVAWERHFGLLQRYEINFVGYKLYGPHKKQRLSEDKEKLRNPVFQGEINLYHI